MKPLSLTKTLIQSSPSCAKPLQSAIPTWRRSLAQPAQEFSLTKAKVISGKIPTALNGSFYRNGAARVTRGTQVVKHWVDGDGAVLAVHFKDGEASATYKYIKSPEYLEEEAADKFIYAGFGSTMNLPFWKKPIIEKIKNTGSISVLPLKDKLLALWDGGLPYHIDPETLETYGTDRLGFLKEQGAFSAHPKVDPETEEIYSFGIQPGPRMKLGVYKLDKTGKLLQQNSVPIRFNLIHDCVIAGKYLIIMNFPTKIDSVASILLGLKSIQDLVHWAPELGTEVFIFDRNDMSLVKQFKMDPIYSCHFANGYEEKDGSIYLELLTYKDYHSFANYAASVPDMSKTLPPGLTPRLTSLRIDPHQGKLIDFKHLTGEGFEFPSVGTKKVGMEWRNTLLGTGSSQNKHAADDQFGAIALYDRQTQDIRTFEYGKDKYCAEPALAEYEDDPENGYILSQVYDAANHKSEIWIHDSRTVEREPLCRLELPSVVPLGFHGKWQSKA